MAGDRRKAAPFADFPSVLATLAERGYAVASVEYRLSAEAKFPAQIEDVKAAIAWLQVHASDYGIDPSRSVAWGVSAGAHLAALAAVTCDSAASGRAPAVSQRDCVQAVVGWYGLYDFSTVAEQARLGSDISRSTADAPEWRLLGCVAEACGTRLQAASPVAHVTSHSPPMLLIVGDSDRLIPHQQTLEMAQRLSAAGVPHKLVVIPGADHSFRGKTLGQTREANLTALDDTLRFLDQMFSRGAAAPAPP